MKEFRRAKLLGLLIGAWLCAPQGASAGMTFPLSACNDREEWNFTSTFPPLVKQEFRDFISKKDAIIHGLAEAMYLEKNGSNDEQRLFGAYWKNRALYESDLVHVAAAGFNNLAGQPVTADSVGIQTAALECLNAIQKRHPRLHILPAVAARLPKYLENYSSNAWHGRNEEVFWTTALIYFEAQLAEGRPASEINKTMALLRRSGPYEALAQGLWKTKEGPSEVAIEHLERFLAEKELPQHLVRFKDHARLAMARLHYTTKNYRRAAEELNKVSKDSNYMGRVLAELAWVYMMENRYGEAIATALNFYSGGFQDTFGPDAMMIMAMSLNELCQFPASLRTVKHFRGRYRAAYDWLRNWYIKKEERTDYYPLIIRYIEDKKSVIPRQVLSEWLRSPVFISYQEEMNLLLDETKAGERIKKSHKSESLALVDEVRKVSQDIREQMKAIRIAKTADKNRKVHLDPSIYKEVREKMEYLKELKTHLAKVRASGPAVSKIVAAYEAQSPQIRKRLVAAINQDITLRNLRMLRRLKEDAENTYLIEVEIYNGASEDVVWQNAHPDYKKVAKQWKSDAEKAVSDKVLNWGPTHIADDGTTEIWADELGSLKANLFNNCTNRDKYLNLVINSKPRESEANNRSVTGEE